MSTSDWLGLAGLMATIVLGLAAILIAAAFDRRARRSSDEATETLEKVETLIDKLSDMTSHVDWGVSETKLQVEHVRDGIQRLYSDVLGIINQSVSLFLRDISTGGSRVGALDNSRNQGSREPAEAGVDERATTRLTGPSHDGADAVIVDDMAPSIGVSGVREEVRSTIAELGKHRRLARARDVVGVLEPGPLMEAISELYRLRIAREISWDEAVLTPDTWLRVSNFDPVSQRD